MSRRVTLLTAQWRWLAMLNWRVDPSLLAEHVPRGTELDTWRGAHYVSVVGFLFLDTRLLGIPIPLHRNFEEVNLRFYVRRTTGGAVRRGVTFLRELVPRGAVAAVARLAFNEPYRSLDMRHRIELGPSGAPERVQYDWCEPTRWSHLAVEPAGAPAPVAPGSEEEFITEHYWGYTRQRDGGTVEYRVEHPRWRVWKVATAVIEGDLEATYGPRFASVLSAKPGSAFLAEGSRVKVMRPERIRG